MFRKQALENYSLGKLQQSFKKNTFICYCTGELRVRCVRFLICFQKPLRPSVKNEHAVFDNISKKEDL